MTLRIAATATLVTLLAVTLGVAVLLLGTGTTPLHAQAVEGPPPEYVFVATDEVSEPRQLLVQIRSALIRAISETDLAPAGFPKPCHITREPDPDRDGGSLIFCVEEPPASADSVPGEPAPTDSAPTGTGAIEPDGILFDADGHHMRLSIVDFADTRVYLTRVYLVPRMPYAPLETMQRLETPRVVLHFPHFPDSWHPEFWSVLERGLEAAGAQPVDLGPIAPESDGRQEES